VVPGIVNDSISTAISMEEKFQKVILKRMEPVQYVKHLKMHPGRFHSTKKDYLSDSQYDWSEIFYKQINKGFWVFSLETEEKADTCYVYQPKNATNQYFSINYYEARNSFGYQLGEEIKWNKNITIFSGPSTTYKIYIRKKSPVKCYRLVFSGRYLKKFLNFFAPDSRLFQPSQIISTGKGDLVRNTHEIETMALQKLHYLLRQNRSNFNYNLSLTANTLDITDLFFKISSTESTSARGLKADEELMARIITQLERQIQNKFPGINALAADFYISPTKLKNSFKRIYQMTPLVYFRKLQMIYAIEVLKRKEMTVKELAMELGFKKSSTFSVWFRRYTGKLPHEL
jgi:AraC-like DNA-binding protein